MLHIYVYVLAIYRSTWLSTRSTPSLRSHIRTNQQPNTKNQNQAFGPLLDALDEAEAAATAVTAALPQPEQQQQGEAADATTAQAPASADEAAQQPQQQPQTPSTPPTPANAPLLLLLARLRALAAAPTYLRRQLFARVALAIPATSKRLPPGVVAAELLPPLVALARDRECVLVVLVVVVGWGAVGGCV